MAPKIVDEILHFLLVLLILLLLLAFIAFIGVPSYIARFFIARLAKYWAPDLGKILTTKSSLPGVDDITGQPKQNLIIYFILKGDPDFEAGVRYALEHALEARDPKTRQLVFPEMQQFVVRWAGFLFWKWDRCFNIYNHVRFYNDAVKETHVTEENYYAIGSELTYAPFKPCRSPWEILVFPKLKLNPENYPNDHVDDVLAPHFGVMMRVHHTLADGFSLTRMLNVDFGGKETINIKTSNFVPIQPRLSVWKKATYLLKAPYDFVSESIKAHDGLSSWHVPEGELSRVHNSHVSPAISMNYIKEIKNAHGCSFTSVLISAFAGAIRRFMDEASRRGDKKYERPSRVHCIHPLPMPSHPEKLRNHMTACFIELPIDILDAKTRFVAIEEDLLRAKNGTLYPIAMYSYMCLLGGLPACLIKLFAKNTLCTAFMSNFPGDNTELIVIGYPMKTMYFAGGFTAGNIGMGFASISYNGNLRIVAGMDSAIVSNDKLDARVFVEYFMAELDALKLLKRCHCFGESVMKLLVDYVLVWDSTSPENDSSSALSASAARARAIFEENLRKEGLHLSYEETTPWSPHLAHLHFVSVRVPIDVLRCYAEILKLRLPMKRFSASAFGAGKSPGDDLGEEFEFDTESIQQQQQQQRNRGGCGLSWARFKRRYLELNPAAIPSGSCHNIYGYDTGNSGSAHSSSSQQRLSAVYSRDREYLFAFDELNEYAFFTPSIRHRIIDFILKRTPFTTRQEQDGDAEEDENLDLEFGIEKLLKDGVYLAAYPLHDGNLDSISSIRHLLFNEWAALSRCFKYQPLNIIKDYFGVKIGMYFAWLGFYTTMLIPIAVLGLLCFLYGLATIQDNVHIADICGGVVQEPMCPLCNKYCNYWNLKDTCFYAKLTHLFDNESTFLFAIVISLWTVIFLEYWKRYSATTCYQWDLGSGSTDVSDQHPRAEYIRRLRHVTRKKINAITRRAEPRVSFWRSKLPNMLLSMSVSWLLISLAVAAIMGVILYRISLKVLVLSEWTKSSYGLLVVNISAVMVNLVFILCFNNLYSSLAVYLTEIELHRTQTEFDDSLSLKIYLLQFVNFYSSIFYIAFFKGKFSGSPYKYNEFLGYRNEECSPGGCMSELCIQLAIIMVGKQVLNAIVEMSTPVVKKWVKNCRSKPTSNAAPIKQLEDSNLYLSPNPITQSAFKTASGTGLQTSAAQPPQCIEDYELLEWDSRSLFPEYLEMVLQFGFITIFISAFPLGPLFALVNNVFEMRLDGKKMLKYFRRPVSQRIVGDIGIWGTVLDTIAKLAVVSNAFILGFTSDFIPKLIYRLEFGSLEGYLQYSLAYFNTSGFDDRSRPDPRLVEHGGQEYVNVTVCRYESFGRSRAGPAAGYENDFEVGAGGSDEVDDLYWKVWLARFIFVVCFQNFVFSCLVVLEWIIPDVPKELADQIRQEEYLTNEIIIKNEVGRVKQAKDVNDGSSSASAGKAKAVAVAKLARASYISRSELQTSAGVMNQLEIAEIVDDEVDPRNESACSSNSTSSTTEISTRL